MSSIYTPSAQDYADGSVNLILTATNGNGDTQDDEMLLTFIEAPSAPAMPVGPTEVDALTTVNSEYTTTAVIYTDAYSWAIAPAEAGTISGDWFNRTC